MPLGTYFEPGKAVEREGIDFIIDKGCVVLEVWPVASILTTQT